MDVNCSLYKRNGKNISICSFDNEMYKCTINFNIRWIYKVPGKTPKYIKFIFLILLIKYILFVLISD